MSSTSGKKRTYMNRKRWDRIWIRLPNTIKVTYIQYICPLYNSNTWVIQVAHPLLVLKVCSSLQKHRVWAVSSISQTWRSQNALGTCGMGSFKTVFVCSCMRLLLNSSSHCCYYGTKGIFRSNLS